jgi:hypothetical protein
MNLFNERKITNEYRNIKNAIQKLVGYIKAIERGYEINSRLGVGGTGGYSREGDFGE